MAIEVGYGFEGALPDALCGRIRDRVIFPKFRAGDVAGGLEDGADALLHVMAGEKFETASANQENNGMVLMVAIVFILVLFVLIRRARKGAKPGAGGSSPGASAGAAGGALSQRSRSSTHSRSSGGGGFRGGGGRSGGGGARGGW